MNMTDAIRVAVKNIATHGDTDIFPLPFETLAFFDDPAAVQSVVEKLDKSFETSLPARSPTSIEALAQVGYSGFRWAMQIDPFWNAYYLALVIKLAKKIETQRLPQKQQSVFSYRYKWDEVSGRLFTDSHWNDYRRRALSLAESHSYVVVTDIADFYTRIYHHRVENALYRFEPSSSTTVRRLMKLLQVFSRATSYGLPVGGPASRMLSELALNDADQHLSTQKITFCRYSDDYTMFCRSKSDAYKALVLLSEKLFNEGLALQKKKTRILTAAEFKDSSALLDPQKPHENSGSDERKLLSISIRYDPYAANAEKEYKALKVAMKHIDVIGILGREVAKPAIDTAVSRQAIAAIRALNKKDQERALRTLLDQENLAVLLPVFVSVLRAVRDLYSELSTAAQDYIDDALIALYDSESFLLSLDLHLSYFVQALGQRRSARKEQVLSEIHAKSTSTLVRRLVILAMANWNCHYWISDVIKRTYSTASAWEKRSMIAASHILGDEGDHWRKHTKLSWPDEDKVI